MPAGSPLICPNCGRECPHDSKFCSFDGTILTPTGPTGTVLATPSDERVGSKPEPGPGPGSLIANRFLLKDRLGQGSFGSTFLCFDQLFKRDAVLKLLHSRWLDEPEVRRRFTLEALALSRISHPNVVQVYDRGELPDGTPYFAMELAKGTLVSSLLKAGPVAEQLVRDIGAQLCDALDAAHRRGFIHRDLKPDNLMLGEDENGQPLLKVLDFGIAAVTEGAAESAVRALKSEAIGQIIGTIAYMSPEVARGEEATAASDIYSAGVVLYHLLTGRLPAELPTKPTPINMLIYVQSKPLPMLRARPGLSPSLVAIVNRAMQKDPANRFASASEMASALRTSGAARRRGRTLAVAAVIGVVALGGLAALFALHRSSAAAAPPPSNANRVPKEDVASPQRQPTTAAATIPANAPARQTPTSKPAPVPAVKTATSPLPGSVVTTASATPPHDMAPAMEASHQRSRHQRPRKRRSAARSNAPKQRSNPGVTLY